MRNRGLSGIEAVVKRQKLLVPERHNNRLLGRRKHGGPGFGGSNRGIDAEFPAQLYHFSAPPPNLWWADRRLALTVLQF